MLNKYKDKLPRLFKLWSEYFEYKFTGLVDNDLPLYFNGWQIKYDIFEVSFSDESGKERSVLIEAKFESSYYQNLYSIYNDFSIELEDIRNELSVEKIKLLNQFNSIVNQIEAEYYDGVRVEATRINMSQEYKYDLGTIDKIVHIIKRVQAEFVFKLNEKIDLWNKQNEEINDVLKLQDGKRFGTKLTEKKLMHFFILINEIGILSFPSKEILKQLISNTINSKNTKNVINYDSLQKHTTPDHTDLLEIIDELEQLFKKIKKKTNDTKY